MKFTSALGWALLFTVAIVAVPLAVWSDARFEGKQSFDEARNAVRVQRLQAAQSAQTDMLRSYIEALRRDVEAAHVKIDRLRWQLDIVIRTCPGRERAPQLATPPPVRPDYPGGQP